MCAVRKYCVTYGAARDNTYQGYFFMGGQRNYPDNRFILEKLRYRCSIAADNNKYKSIGDPCVYSGFIYPLTTGDAFCYGRSMLQIIQGRVVDCAQYLICDVTDIRRGDSFVQEVIDFPYLSREELLDTDENTTLAEIFKPISSHRESATDMPLQRQRLLSRIAFALLSGEKVFLRLIEDTHYEQKCLDWLRDIYRWIPSMDRCEVSFTTTLKSGDHTRAKDFDLILTDTSLQLNTYPGCWLDEDQVISLTDEENCILCWNTLPEEDRKELEGSRLFMPTGINERRDLHKDLKAILSVFDKENYWWQGESMHRFSDINSLVRHQRENPSLILSRNAMAYYKKADQWLDTKDCSHEDMGENMIELTVDYVLDEMRKGERPDIVFGRIRNELYGFGMGDTWIEDTMQDFEALLRILDLKVQR